MSTGAHPAPVGIQPGDLVVARNRKFNGKAHWVVPGRYLGTDEHGHWIFQGTNEFISRPGAALYTESDAVLLIPHTGSWVATFYDDAHPTGCRMYIDLALDLDWQQIRPGIFEFHMIDMDLDVISTRSRGVFIDDEDEFAEHRVLMDYPPAVAAAIEAECQRIFAAVTDGAAPFDGRDTAWFAKGRVDA
ncbi:DUF402 domain-containing protein [Arthrobacter sp. 35W]|uniref:DUF402 domain-containing protein n=1 Tax=Arthrobacter sp. 35W TaxID=1132441 RepID=UPI0003F95C4F|nr:DUF402 domain-containing protein [Arthrobacter sp. 35W]